MQTATPGLRERKRLATRRRIADAALELTLSRGLEGATIEAISGQAGISARTFFNYFESKEAALLDAPEPDELAAIITDAAESCEGLSLREVAVRMFVHRIRSKLEGGEAHALRRELYDRHPELFAAAFQQLVSEQEAFAAGLLEVAKRRGLDFADEAWSEVAIAAAWGAVRHALHAEIAAGSAAQATPEIIYERAYALLSSTLENFS